MIRDDMRRLASIIAWLTLCSVATAAAPARGYRNENC